MSRLTDQKESQGVGTDADPLPDTKVQGDSKETDEIDAANDFMADDEVVTPYDD